MSPTLLLTALSALAADAPALPATPEVPAAPEVPEVPAALQDLPRRGDAPALPEAPLRAVGFLDLPGDCPAVAAREGECVEEVGFLDLSDAWQGQQKDRIERATLHTMGDLWTRNLEVLAYRWFRDKDLPETTLQADGLLALPSPARTWDVARPDPRRSYALPDQAAWVDAADWTGADGLFRPVRAAVPAGAPQVPDMLVLRGRFAERLGYDGRPYDFDVMDADREVSAPFFEQMYPFAMAWASGDRGLVPLADFGFPRQLATAEPTPEAITAALGATLLSQDTWDELQGAAARQFDDFALLLGVQIARYAMAEHTPNHLRVLAALTLMRSPPAALSQTAGRTRDLVAAALGQTDATDEAEARINRAALALEGGFKLRYPMLPSAVVRPWLDELLDQHPPDLGWITTTWEIEANAMLGTLRRPDAPPLRTLRPDELTDWLRVALVPGKDTETFALELQRLALKLRVEALGEELRDEVETRIFLDHVNAAISGGLDSRPGSVLTPDEVVALAGDQWRGVIASHGRASRPVSQGLGAVDPTAICTTQDGKAAQSEPSLRPANLDVLVAAKAGFTQDTVTDLLMDRRDELPLLAVDNPNSGAPALSRLVDLPDGRTLYRLRWTVWTGWHLWWTSEALSTGQRRLAARSAAVCSDLVLASPALAPTLARAALLDGELRPTTPVRGRDLRAARRAPPAAGLPIDPERAAWIQELSRAPLRATASPGALVAVFDVSDPQRRRWFEQLRPRTPYLNRQRVTGWRKTVRTSAWVWYLRAAEGEAPALVAPALRPDANVASEIPRPRWHQVPTTEFDLGVGLSAEPARYALVSCRTETEDQDVVDRCSGTVDGYWSYGFGADLEALTTVWLRADHRFAFESGLVMRLDLTPPGHAWQYLLIDDGDGSDPLVNGPDYSWGFRPAVGLTVGLRGAPLPLSLHRVGARSWPWGADRPDGSSALARNAYGLRLTGLYGTSYSGAELSGAGELWWARSVRDPRGAHAPFTPYHPALWIGPYAEGMMSFHPPFLSVPDEQERVLELRRAWSVHFGVRGHFRLKAPVSSLPEAP